VKSSAPPPNRVEQDRIDRVMQMCCLVCALHGDVRMRPRECHHIVRGNKRLGHWWTIQLCTGHHRGLWSDQPVQVAVSDGRVAFRAAHGYDDLQLWQRQQVLLGLDDALPASKIYHREAVA